MTITRHQHKKPPRSEEKQTITADEFILAVEDNLQETSADTEISVLPKPVARTTKQRATYVMESFLPWAFTTRPR